MNAQVFQIDRPENRGERAMLDFLSRLPPEYAIYRELKVNRSFNERTEGLRQGQPDFVVVGEDVGVVSIEVKDWNIDRNQYRWQNQRKIERVGPGGESKFIGNPVHQAERYLYALKGLIDDLPRYPFVSSLVAFPKLTKRHFYNQMGNVDALEDPQARFYLNPDRTLFKDDLTDHITQPERLLERVVQRDDRFSKADGKAVYEAKERLLPSSFRIGDYTEREQQIDQLKTLTEEQQQWVFDLSSDKNYLLDVAGSGKTNCLISKALHLVDRAPDQEKPQILLTTYSRDLGANIERIFKHKVENRDEQEAYEQYIAIRSLPDLMEALVREGYDTDSLESFREDKSPEAYREWLQEQATNWAQEDPSRYRRFDHIFVDEVQDLDNDDLVLLSLLSKTQNYFFVGDFGQKIYDRTHDLNRIGFIPSQVELPKSYQTHRTPRHIARLATEFVLSDAALKREFEQQGYTGDREYPNESDQMPEVEHAEAPVEAATERIENLLVGGPSGNAYRPSNIMLVTSEDRIPSQMDALTKADIPHVRGEALQGDKLNVVDFWSAKGLEKEAVIAHGVEDLFDRVEDAALFGSERDREEKERQLRRVLYVCLTRPLERFVLFYEDGANPFIEELKALSRTIEKDTVR